MKRFIIALLALIAIATGARSQDMSATPLTLEAISGGEITFQYSLSLYHDGELTDIEYQLNDGAWTAYTWNDPIAVTAGEKVAFRGNNASYMGNGKGYESHITSTADVYVYGNVMSLVNSTDFATLTTLTGKDAFSHLFSVPGANAWDVVPNTTIKSHPTKDLVLPATTLTNMCYMNMFSGCQGLTRAPELPATELPVACYASMFEGCTSLTEAPALPTTTFTPYGMDPVTNEEYGSIDCYMGMFKDCTSLTKAPALPATTLIHGVYQNMFQGCTSLERAPDLLAPIVADYAYSYMFDGCTSLNYVKCLATDFYIDPDFQNTAEDNVNQWLNNVAATGTFVKADEMTAWAEGVSGIPSGWTVLNNSEVFDPYTEPLTFESLSSSLMINFNTKMNIFGLQHREYNASNDTWSDWQTISNGNVNNYVSVSGVGSKIQFKREDNTPLATDYNTYSCFKNRLGNCYVYGNVMSLYNFETVLNDNYACYGLFDGNTGIRNHPTKDLVLGATALSTSCYMRMFRKCTGLTRIPELPASTLAKNCYSEMFKGCTALNTTPVLPATTMAESCYYGMFRECTSLTISPNLPATTLAVGCYWSMFYGCTNLQTVPALPATIMMESCYSGMFSGCTSLQTAPELPATTLAVACYHGMFEGCTGLTVAPALPATVMVDKCYKDMFSNCTNLQTAPALPSTSLAYWCYYKMFEYCTSLTTAPVLPATTLAEGCYIWMFWGCTNLNYVKCLATDISADNCTLNWLNYVSPTGTFIKADGMDDWEIGLNPDGEYYGIPEGWTVGNVGDYESPLTIEIIESGTKLTVTNFYGPTYEISLNNGSWLERTYQDVTTTLPDGVKTVSFRCDNAKRIIISTNKPCYVYGNVMSMVSKTDFANCTEITEEDAFVQMFMGAKIMNHPQKDLVLPATTLSDGCYYAMFENCTNLTKAPALPATTLTKECYSEMFSGCTNLTTAPDLPAETLAEGCYKEMFSGCTNLNYVKCLATDISAADCTNSWLYNVAATGTFVKAQGMTAWTTGVDGIPTGWTVLDPNQFTYTVPSSGVGTFSNNVAFTLPEGLAAYYCNTFDAVNSTISMVKIDGAVPANTGVLLKGTARETYILTTTTENPDAISDNALVAVTTPTHIEPTTDIAGVNYTNFMLKSGQFIKIAASASTSKMAANKAYLQIPTADINNGGSVKLMWPDDMPTGVEEMDNGQLTMDNDGVVYDLSGRQIKGIGHLDNLRFDKCKSPHGIYIKNGKKVLVK